MKESKIKLETYLTRQKLKPSNREAKKKDTIKKISGILRKKDTLRSQEDNKYLESIKKNDEKLLETLKKQIKKRKEYSIQLKTRVIEKEDDSDVIDIKVKKLAEIISKAKYLVCYTGAGISTSAKIPDYRGSQGIWTLLKEGKDFGKHDISKATPTFTHMALFELHRQKILRHVISQNCDGLHIRSGIPRKSLSELHGNMYIEVCKHCKPNREYLRLFDTTEDTARFNHKTKRQCYICKKSLSDTIVHFGERGSLKWPLNWDGACKSSENADVILCLGSSLKVLKKYHWLWQVDKPKNQRAKICIVNLQWTPKDKCCAVKINGKCDEVLRSLMKQLNVRAPCYDRNADPIFHHATPLLKTEVDSVTQPILRLENNEKNILTSSNGRKFQSHIKTNLNCNPLDIDDKPEEELKTEDDDSESSQFKENCLDENSFELELLKKADISELDNVYTKEEFCNAYLNNNEKIIGSIKIKAENGDFNLSEIDKSLKYKSNNPFLHLEIMNDPLALCASEENGYSKSDLLIQNSIIFQKMFDLYFERQQQQFVLPNWYEPKWCYPGLHQIIKPPPQEINFWSSAIVPIFKLNKKHATCNFCFEHYAEFSCQFYNNVLEKNISKRKISNDTLSDVCDEESTTDTSKPGKDIQAGWFGKGYRKVNKKRKK